MGTFVFGLKIHIQFIDIPWTLLANSGHAGRMRAGYAGEPWTVFPECVAKGSRL